jgi:hypothetical protein
MADYYLVLDGAFFEEQLRPALAGAWRRRSFEPCRLLCRQIEPLARAYAQRYHLADHEPLVTLVASGLPFDRLCWRTLVGEVLLFAALDIPELQTSPDTLCCLLAPQQYAAAPTSREMMAPIQQALFGSRDLTFGAAVYRPEQAGYNDRADVARLAAYLAAVRPEHWTIADLAAWPEAESDDERAEELAFVREWFPVLVDLYDRCRRQGHILIHESIP